MLKRLVALIYIFQSLFLSTPVQATQGAMNSLPVMQRASLRGVGVLPSEGLKMQFLFEQKNQSISRQELDKVIRIFMAGLTMEPSHIWVNLSPYEPERLMAPLLAVTELGQGLVEQDYLLKQRASLLTHPDTDLGKKFWQQALAVSSANKVAITPKVWIVPDVAVVYHLGQRAMLGKLHLKVMVERDYLALQKNKGQKALINNVEEDHSTALMRQMICPVLEREVNESPDFAPLREMYQALVLAQWFKKYHGKNLASLGYIEQSKIKGIDVNDDQSVKDVYRKYVHFYKKGAYNFVREDSEIGVIASSPKGDAAIVARKYFSGGLTYDPAMVQFIDASMTTDRSFIERIFGQMRWIGAIVVFAALLSSGNVQAAETIKGGEQKIFKSYDSTKGAERLGQILKERNAPAKKNPITITPPVVAKQQIQAESTSVNIPPGAIYPEDPVIVGVDMKPDQQSQQGSIAKAVLQESSRMEIPPGGILPPQEIIKGVDLPSTVSTPVNEPPISAQENGFVDASTSNTTTAGSPPPPDEDLSDWANAGSIDQESGLTNASVVISPPTSKLNISARGEIGYLLSGTTGPINRTDVQLDYKLMPRYSMYGGMQFEMMPQMKTMESEDPMGSGEMMSLEEKEIGYDLSPYLGLHRVGDRFDVFAQVQDWTDTHLGIESRPIYNKGFSYKYGASLVTYNSSSDYQVGGMMDGYISLRLSKMLGIENDILDKTYLSVLMRMAMSQEGVGVGGNVRLTYNNRWQAIAEISPFRDMPFMQEAIGHHDSLYGLRLGAAYKFSERMSALIQWVEPIGHMDERSSSFMLGLWWELGKRRINHGDQYPSIDYLNFPKYKFDKAMISNGRVRSSYNRRDFLEALLKGTGLVLFSSKSAIAQTRTFSQTGTRFYQVLVTNDDPACGEPQAILEVGKDPLKDTHMVYLAFMFWYLKDKSNAGILLDDRVKTAVMDNIRKTDNEVFESNRGPRNPEQIWVNILKNKEKFSQMDPWQWEALLETREVVNGVSQRTLTEDHRDLVDVIQAMLVAEAFGNASFSKAQEQLVSDGELFHRKFRTLMDRYIYYERSINRNVINYNNLLIQLRSGQEKLMSVLTKFVTAEDVKKVLSDKGIKTDGYINQALSPRNMADYLKANPKIAIEAAKVRLRQLGESVTPGEGLNPTIIKMIQKRLIKAADKAMRSVPTGGIDFSNLPQLISWNETMSEKTLEPMANRVIGMTYQMMNVEYLSSMNLWVNKQSSVLP